MRAKARDQRMLGAISRVLDPDEQVEGRGSCWAAVRRPRVPLLLLGRHRYDVFVTDRRLILIAHHRREVRPSDVMLVKRFDALVLDGEHRRPMLRQQRIRTDRGAELVVEWPRRSRALGRRLAEAVPGPTLWATT